MNVIKVGDSYRIYSDNTKTFKSLPIKTYIVNFSQMTGFSLEEYHDLDANISKIYGVHESKVDKVLSAFEKRDKNLGVILSGQKGIGKSLCARMMANKAISSGYPVIVIDRFYPGIESFIEQIEQPIVLLFDEFDKTFHLSSGKGDMNDPQTSLLSLFDGTSVGKKLFIITCNEISRLNEFLVNRPGRFHYHLRFDYPDIEEVTQYLMDNVEEQYHSEIPKVVAFAQRINLNFDCLNAIAFELNNGEEFASAIQDLNIINTEKDFYDGTLYLADGRTFECQNESIDLFRPGVENLYFRNHLGHYEYIATFNTQDVVYDESAKCVKIEGSKLNVNPYDYDEDECKEEIHENVKCIILRKHKPRNLHYNIYQNML